MTDKIIEFPVKFEPKVSYDAQPVNQVLLNADKEKLDEVIVLGYKKEDGQVKIFTSESDCAKIIYLCEYAKALITKSVIGELYLDIKQK